MEKRHNEHNDSYYTFINDKFLKQDQYNIYFKFYPSIEYLETILDYFNAEYMLDDDCTSILLQNYLQQSLQKDTAIFVDFESNTLKYCNMDEYEPLHTPTKFCTDNVYFKPVLHLLYENYLAIEGISYIAYNFYQWSAHIVSDYTERNDILILDRELKLNLSSAFLTKFFKFYKNEPINSNQLINFTCLTSNEKLKLIVDQ